MAISIVLSTNGKAPTWNEATSISFSDDADYWYLWPTMIAKIKKETGELIDLYDDAEFSEQNLVIVEKLIREQLCDLTNQRQAEWDVYTGTQTYPVKKDIYKKLIKKDLLHKLEKFLCIVQVAKEKSEKIICIGD